MSVSAVMIARNEARCISRAISSIRDHVDEIILVDTGSTDNTVELAKKEGASVYFFPWCDDFSAARNYSLSLVKTDWCLVMDSDEYLLSGGDSLRNLCQKKSNEPIGINITIKNITESTTHYTFLPRLLSNTVRYEGIVHEQPILITPCELSPIIFAHDGYLKSSAKKKQNRNIQLLKQVLPKSSEDKKSYYHFQLGVEYTVNHNFDSAISHFDQALLNETLLNNPIIKNDLISKYLFSLAKANQFQKGVDFSKRYQDQFQNIPAFFYGIGVLLVDWARYDKTLWTQLHPKIESAFIKTLNLCKQYISEKSITPGITPHDYFCLACENLIFLYQATQNNEKAEHCKKLIETVKGMSHAS